KCQTRIPYALGVRDSSLTVQGPIDRCDRRCGSLVLMLALLQCLSHRVDDDLQVVRLADDFVHGLVGMRDLLHTLRVGTREHELPSLHGRQAPQMLEEQPAAIVWRW